MEHSHSGQNTLIFHLADGCGRNIRLESPIEAHLIQGIVLQICDYFRSNQAGPMTFELSKQPPSCTVSSEEGKWNIDDLMDEGAIADEITDVAEENGDVVQESSVTATRGKYPKLTTPKEHDRVATALMDKKLKHATTKLRYAENEAALWRERFEAQTQEQAFATETAQNTDEKIRKLEAEIQKLGKTVREHVQDENLKKALDNLQTRYDSLQARNDNWQTRYDFRTKISSLIVESFDRTEAQRVREIQLLQREINYLRGERISEIEVLEAEIDKRRELAGEVVNGYIEEDVLRGDRIEELESTLKKHKISIPAERVSEAMEERRKRYINARRELFYTGRLR